MCRNIFLSAQDTSVISFPPTCTSSTHPHYTSLRAFKASYTLHHVVHKALAFTTRDFLAVRYYM